jgi:hypothetical protein
MLHSTNSKCREEKMDTETRDKSVSVEESAAHPGMQTNEAPKDKLLNVAELAAHLKVKPSWVYYANLPKIKVGKYCRYDLNEVLEHLKKQQGGN